MQRTKTETWMSEYNNIIKENDNLYRDAAKRHALPECAFWILYILRTNGNTFSQSEICEALYQPKQTVNSSLKSLEAEGYLRLYHEGDRRSKIVTLTKKGVELAQKTADKIIAAEQSALFALTEEEQQAFIDLFRKYTAALKSQMYNMEDHQSD